MAGAIEVEPERVLDVIRGALRAIVERESVVLQVNPDDLELVREWLTRSPASLGGIEHVEVQEERRVERGGALCARAWGRWTRASRPSSSAPVRPSSRELRA